MGRPTKHLHTLADGQRVGYDLFERRYGKRKLYTVRFVASDGRRVDRATRCDTVGTAHGIAHDIIDGAYAVGSAQSATPPATWEVALAKLDATPDLRPDSIRDYRNAVAALRKLFPDLAGPAAVTEEVAERFKHDYLAGTYTRGKASDAAEYKRSPTSCRSYLRCLRSLWRKHFKAKTNPWLTVAYPNARKGKRVRLASETAIAEFFVWLAAKHPRWELPALFVQVKIMAGCRTMDLCQAKTADLGAGCLILRAETTKNREDREIELPPETVRDLRRVAGPVWLWECSVAESKQHRRATRTAKQTEYSPSTWRYTIQNLFKQFNKGRPKAEQLRPHDLRARAITLIAKATNSVDQTAKLMGVDPATARHYLDSEAAFGEKTAAIRREMAALLAVKVA